MEKSKPQKFREKQPNNATLAAPPIQKQARKKPSYQVKTEVTTKVEPKPTVSSTQNKESSQRPKGYAPKQHDKKNSGNGGEYQQRNQKERRPKGPIVLSPQQIERRLALPPGAQEKIYEGVYVSKEWRMGEGGRIKTKGVMNKVEVPAKCVKETIHESVVYWAQIRRVKPREPRRPKQQGKGQKEKSANQRDNKDKDVKVRGQEETEQVKINQNQKQQTPKQQQQSGEQDAEVGAQIEAGSDSQEEEEGKKQEELDTIIARIVQLKTNGYQDRPIVCTITPTKRKYPKESKKPTSELQFLNSQYLFDAYPINPRLPKFELDDLFSVEECLMKQMGDISVPYRELRGAQRKEREERLLKLIKSRYFVIKYKEWLRFQKYPIGKVVKLLKTIKTPQGQSEAYLEELELVGYEHPEYPPMQIQPTPLHKRFDKLVFTIDPATSVDLDDALSIQKIGEDLYEVGIHISDVTTYLRHLDRDRIAELSTSVYLPYKVLHMLPHSLVEVCTLKPSVDRLAFTVFVTLDQQGNVVAQRFEKNIIKSRCQFSYEIAQDVITGKIAKREDFPERFALDQSESASIIERIRLLDKLAKHRRSRRLVVDVFNNKEMCFELDSQYYPLEYKHKQRVDAHKMVEEFMILGNERVATKIVKEFGVDSLIISHPPPSELNKKYFNKAFTSYKYNFVFSDMLDLQKQLKVILQDPNLKQEVAHFLILKASRVQQLAVYERSGDPNYRKPHFALALDYYTHFTSPMRRFADCVVHQQLLLCLNKEQLNAEQESRLDKEIGWMNKRRQSTKRLKQKIMDSFFCLMIHKNNQPVKTKGFITSFGTRSMSLFIPDFDMVREIIWRKELQVDWVEYDLKDKEKLDVKFWEDNKICVWKAEKHCWVGVEIDCTVDCPLELVFSIITEVEGKTKVIKAKK